MSDPPFDPGAHLHLEVWLREPYPYGAHEQQASVLERVRALQDAGVLDRVDVRVWGHHVPAEPSADAPPVVREVREQVATFEGWAEEAGCSLAPAFDTCRWSGDLVAEPTEVVSMPLLCLAVYADDDLVSVTPCRGGPVETVGECLSALEAAGDADAASGAPGEPDEERTGDLEVGTEEAPSRDLPGPPDPPAGLGTPHAAGTDNGV